MTVVRLVQAIPVVLVVATISFVLVQLMPGSPAEAVLGQRATPEAIARLEAEQGLDRPVLVQYVDSIVSLLRLDLGTSLVSGAGVLDLLGDRLPITMSMALLGLAVSAVVGIGIGAYAAVRGGWWDGVLTSLSGLGLAVPNFWLGSIAVLVFAIWWDLLPATGYVAFGRDPAQWLVHLVLPVGVLAVIQVASIARQTRTAMQEQLRQDYVRALRATGTPRRVIVWKHALRNASAPVVTTLGLQFVGVLGGTVIIEQVFGLRGIGSLMVEAANVRDVPLLQGIVVFSAIVVLAVNLLVDVLSVLLNPRMAAS